MNNWELIKLGDILTLEYGSGLKQDTRTGSGFPVVGSSGVIGYHSESLINAPGIVVGRKGTVGGLSFMKIDFWPIDTAYFIKPKVQLDWKWLYYKLSMVNFKKLSLSDVVPGLKRELVYNIKINLPPVTEQKAIAEILSTVDNAIKKSDETIARTEKIKREMMNKLFAEGIGHKNFKETKIGKIPSDWEILLAEDICVKVTDGTHDSPKPQSEGKLLFTSKNIKRGNLVKESAYLISEVEYIKANGRSKVDTFDVLFSMIGTIGESAIVFDSPVEFAIKNVGLFKLNGNANLANWFYYYLNSQIANKYIKSNIKGTTQNYITLDSLKNFPIVVPPESEKNKITEILISIDKKLTYEFNRKQKFINIKKILMNDLLTGIKRVKLN